MKQNFIITDSALQQVAKLLADEPHGSRLRVTVEGGGCSGFQYRYSFDATKNPDDLVFGENKAEVIIDETSLSLIDASQLDYFEDLGSAGFEIKNPKATARCGCGNSFSI
jgi:iron-sulfur cluster assembly accessory protein